MTSAPQFLGRSLWPLESGGWGESGGRSARSEVTAAVKAGDASLLHITGFRTLCKGPSSNPADFSVPHLLKC